MKYTPILMNAAMVCATLADIKTQTRRIVKPQPPAECGINYSLGNEGWLPESERTPLRHHWEAWHVPLFQNKPDGHLAGSFTARCPFGKPGDRLWVRESGYLDKDERRFFAYAATPRVFKESTTGDIDETHQLATKASFTSDEWKSVPSIHMPRWASRITLEISDVRAERIQDISEADAIAEGVTLESRDNNGNCWQEDAVSTFRRLWISIYGADAWDRNDWVWVPTFKRIEQDQLQ